MRTVSATPHHARWRPRLGAMLEVGAAIRRLVARLVTGGDHQPNRRRAGSSDDLAEPAAARAPIGDSWSASRTAPSGPDPTS